MKKIFLLEEKKFYYRDGTDGENVEDIDIIGYFSTKEIVSTAINKCINLGMKKEELVCSEYVFNTKKQKYVYILFYEYSIKDERGYTDYFYKFQPQTNKKKCMQLKEELLKKDFYMPNKNKIFDDFTDRGFSIRKIMIDTMIAGAVYAKK